MKAHNVKAVGALVGLLAIFSANAETVIYADLLADADGWSAVCAQSENWREMDSTESSTKFHVGIEHQVWQSSSERWRFLVKAQHTSCPMGRDRNDDDSLGIRLEYTLFD